mgnify:CR=1 FL=1
MPTDLPLVNLLKKSATNGFTLLETMLSLAVLGILLVLAVPDFYPMLQRQRFTNSASEIRALLEETQSLALTSKVSHLVFNDSIDQNLLIERKSGAYEVLHIRAVEDELTVEPTRWPSFGPFGFAQSGTILLDSPEFQTSIVVSSVGRIRQTDLLKK